MPSQFTNPMFIAGACLLVLIAAVGLVAYFQRRKAKTLALRDRFGSEYDRTVAKHPTPREAEVALSARETRVKGLALRDLNPSERDRFVTDWQTLQSRFLDHPKSAVTEADDLISALLVARGYPKDGFEQRAEDVSVSYPRLMEHYRMAHGIAVRPGKADASTEDLRTAMIQYRTIFDELASQQASGLATATA
jgi:hypothetical protein